MSDEADDTSDGMASLPATMADIFFALVAVVIVMLLALAPAIRSPGGLQASAPFEVRNSDLRVGGKSPMVVVAEAGGLRLAKPSERLVPLDQLLDDPGLARDLGAAATGSDGLLLLIQPDGQETAFLFDSLADALGISAIDQIRLDDACGYVVAPDLAEACSRTSPGASP